MTMTEQIRRLPRSNPAQKALRTIMCKFLRDRFDAIPERSVIKDPCILEVLRHHPRWKERMIKEDGSERLLFKRRLLRKGSWSRAIKCVVDMDDGTELTFGLSIGVDVMIKGYK